MLFVFLFVLFRGGGRGEIGEGKKEQAVLVARNRHAVPLFWPAGFFHFPSEIAPNFSVKEAAFCSCFIGSNQNAVFRFR